MKKNGSARVGIIMGSSSDAKVMKEAGKVLKEFGIKFELKVVSAHRTAEMMQEYALSAKSRGLHVIIAGAGGAAHLPGMVASLTPLPVIGVPIALKELRGLDSLLSIVQMPKGVPVATVAINNAHNAGLLAAKIIGLSNPKVMKHSEKHLHKMKAKVAKMQKELKRTSR